MFLIMFLSCLQCPNLAYKLPGKEVLESVFSFKQKGSHFLKAASLMHKRNLQCYKGLRNPSLLLSFPPEGKVVLGQLLEFQVLEGTLVGAKKKKIFL